MITRLCQPLRVSQPLQNYGIQNSGVKQSFKTIGDSFTRTSESFGCRRSCRVQDEEDSRREKPVPENQRQTDNSVRHHAVIVHTSDSHVGKEERIILDGLEAK